MKTWGLLGLACLLLNLAHAEQDSIRPGAVWPDTDGVAINAHGGGVLFHEGTYYWYGEHKIAGPKGNSAQVGVSCYSSKDLYNWKNESIALPVEDSASSDIARGCIIERPKVIYNAKTKKFVMWFHLEEKGKGYGTAAAGVATADKPTGPFRYVHKIRPNPKAWPIGFDEKHDKSPQVDLLKRDYRKGQMSRDMTLFVDDDGQAYQITSAEENYTLHISLLTPDYLNTTGKYVRIFPGGHNEGPAICKHDGKYWMITSGCTGWDPNEARSFVADKISGPWTQLPNPCIGPNPLGGMGPEKTWGGQSTFILPVQGKPGAFIAMFDIWRPKNPIDGGYLWLPIHFENNRILVTYPQTWKISDFDMLGGMAE
jgi:Glycosyl hydrolases family 43